MEDPGNKERIRIGVRELRDNLSGYLRRARQGASITVMSHDEVVAEIVPPSRAHRPHRKPGTMKGRIVIDPDFDSFPEDILDAMER
jgi:antitoxin (DNA-binding transcriptional repressor) of toxin-antitoxin stability system